MQLPSAVPGRVCDDNIRARTVAKVFVFVSPTTVIYIFFSNRLAASATTDGHDDACDKIITYDSRDPEGAAEHVATRLLSSFSPDLVFFFFERTRTWSDRHVGFFFISPSRSKRSIPWSAVPVRRTNRHASVRLRSLRSRSPEINPAARAHT